MTEIALALAMGFFSLMVLTLISMGAGNRVEARPSVLTLAPLAEEKGAQTKPAPKAGKDLIIIFDGNQYLDTALNPIDPGAKIAAIGNSGRRVVLALDPALSLKQAMAARENVKAPNLVVSTLNEQWITALRKRREGR